MPALHRSPPHCIAAGLCVGVAGANAIRAPALATLALAFAFVVGGAVAGSAALRVGCLVLGAAIAGLWWGSVRLEALDRSPLRSEIGTAELTLVEVTGPPRRGRFDIRVPARVLRYGRKPIREPVLLELPLGRSPPQGARLEVLGEIEAPRPARNGFDEALYLRRHGVHVVLRGDRWRTVGRRGGLGGLADRLHGGLGAALASGTTGERRLLLVGIVLGDDAGLPEGLRDRFRASGLYHLLTLEEKTITR